VVRDLLDGAAKSQLLLESDEFLIFGKVIRKI